MGGAPYIYVKSNLIHGDIHGYIYINNTEFFIHYPSLFCSLNKALYGLKQSPRAWYAKMDNFLLSGGLKDANMILMSICIIYMTLLL